MKPEDEKELEYWEIKEKPEGFDVYLYDAQRARQGQIRTLAIFIGALLVFALAAWLNSRHTAAVQEQREQRLIR